MAETPRHPGGFLPPTSSQYARALPSPAPSTASSRAAARLPAPRSKPLVAGSRKEDYARDYVSKRLLHIARRYVKKHGGEEEDDGLQLTLLGAGLQGGDAVLEFGDRVGFLRETSQCVSKQSARAEPASTQHDIV